MHRGTGYARHPGYRRDIRRRGRTSAGRPDCGFARQRGRVWKIQQITAGGHQARAADRVTAGRAVLPHHRAADRFKQFGAAVRTADGILDANLVQPTCW